MIARRSLLGLLAGLPFAGRALAGRGDNEGGIAPCPSPKLFASKGERVTCENGHFVCEAARDIPLGSLPFGNEWTNWRQHQPAFGTPAKDIACEICGAAWFGKTGLAQSMHFASGWR